MNADTNTITYGDSNALKLQRLVREYNNTLTEYQQVNNSYLNSIEDSNRGKNTTKYISVPNSAFWGTGGIPIGNNTATSVKQCQNLCMANSTCSGSTFDPSHNFCFIRTGPGSIVPSTNGQTAIVPEKTQYINVLQSLNAKMENINNQIIEISQQMVVTNVQNQNHISSQTLQNNYQQLLKDRKEIKKVLSEQKNLTEEVNNTDLTITHSYSLYLFFLVLLLIIVYLFFQLVVFSSTTTSENNESMIGGRNQLIRVFKKYFPFFFRK